MSDMNISENRRNYTMTQRADQVVLTDRKIIEAMTDLWLKMPLSELTLEKVSERSEVTVRTKLLKVGSKKKKVCLKPVLNPKENI